ncbi:MAG TPA: PepSY-like domain-containing protein [Isosphaeraceae bacterium]|jgi:hypothetical protein
MTLGTLVKATALVTFGALGVARGEEEKISHEKLPATVKAAIKARFPGAELKAAAKESEEGETIFEVLLTYKGNIYDVAIEPNGEIEEIERAIFVEALPSAVVKAIKAKYPKAELEKAEQVTDEDGEVFYEVAIEVGDKEMEVAVTPKGKIKEAAAEEEEEKGEKHEKAEKHEKKAEKEEGEEHEKAVKKAEKHEKKAEKKAEKHEKKKAEKDDD